MYVCNICDANCDAGELIGGICPECAEKERLRKIMASRFEEIKDSCGVQLRMEDMGIWKTQIQ